MTDARSYSVAEEAVVTTQDQEGGTCSPSARSPDERPLLAANTPVPSNTSQPDSNTQRHKLHALIWDNGVVCMAITAAIFALASFCVKLIHGKISVFEIVAIRSGASMGLVLVSYWRMKPANPDLRVYGSPSNLFKLACRGTFGAAAMTSYYFSIQLLPLGDAVTIFFSNVVITALASVCVGYELFSWLMAVGCLVCLGGVTVLSHPPFLFGGGASWSVQRLEGVAAGMLSATCAALAFLSIKSLGNSEKPIVMSMWFHTCAFVTSLVPVIASAQFRTLPTLRESVLLANVIWTSFAGQLLLSRGFQLLSPSSAAAINLTQVVHARVLATLFLAEGLHWYSIAGSVLTATGVLLVQASKGAGGAAANARGDSTALSLPLDDRDASHSLQLSASVAAPGKSASLEYSLPRHESHVSDSCRESQDDSQLLTSQPAEVHVECVASERSSDFGDAARAS